MRAPAPSLFYCLFKMPLKLKSHIPSPKSFAVPLPKMSSWSCSKCTYLNPPSPTMACKICLSPASPSFLPSSSSAAAAAAASFSIHRWSCSACTFSNPKTVVRCEMCGSRSPTSIIDLVDLEPDEISDPSIGSVFLPLRRCGTKRAEPAAAAGERDEADGSVKGKVRRTEVEEVLPSAVPGHCDSGSDHIIKILSYNVWFREDLELQKRMRALGDIILEHLPNFICFQEVTPEIYSIFQNSEWWRMYKCSVSQNVEIMRPYFCMQMSKLHVREFRRKAFDNSIMGRELCIADVDVGMGKKLVVATSHLESPCPGPPTWDQMFSKERVAQAQESVRILKDFPNVIFGGDMNWDDKVDGAFPMADGWMDAWAELRAGDNGWTYDTKSNQMLSGNRTLQKRLDRFVCNLRDFKISSIEMIGKEAIPGLSYIKEKKVKKEVKKITLPVLPSDHYGLLLTIQSL